ncbi:ATP-binding protein [Streptomyces microflavus]|uniref:ATP-binding protein n=1 Tax=Streptomyces microflavus TaxID=1919 RepID=UPI00339E1A24
MAQDLLPSTELTKHQQTGRPCERGPFPLASRPFVRRPSRFPPKGSPVKQVNSQSFFLVRAPTSVVISRRRLHDLLSMWRIRQDDDSDMAMATVVSELVTNAVSHGAGDMLKVVVSANIRRGRLTIEVHDDSPALPRQCRPGPDAESGRRHGACRTLGDHLWRREHRARQTGLGRAGAATSADGRSALARSAPCGASARPSISDHPMAPAPPKAPDRSPPPCPLSVLSPRGHDIRSRSQALHHPT